MSEHLSIEERQVAAYEKIAEAQLRRAQVAEGHLELAKADSEDRKTLLAAATEILQGIGGYMNALANQENARTRMLEANWTLKELPSASESAET